jgi:hypothetical protein
MAHLPQGLRYQPFYRRPGSVKKSIRSRALFDNGTFDTSSALRDPGLQGIKQPTKRFVILLAAPGANLT